jgi:hypothetical protein
LLKTGRPIIPIVIYKTMLRKASAGRSIIPAIITTSVCKVTETLSAESGTEGKTTVKTHIIAVKAETLTMLLIFIITLR